MPISSIDYDFPGLIDKVKLRLGVDQCRNAYWSWYEPRNFGDWVTPFLFEAMTNTSPRWCSRKNQATSRCVYGAGSILRHISSADMVTVWGSGIMSEKDEFSRPADVRAVRGPRSARRLAQLGYKTTEVFGDPALLLSRYYKAQTQMVQGSIGIIAHYVDQNVWTGKLPDGVILIDVTRPVDQVIEAISACEMTLSSSLHGIIVSQTYGRRSAWISSVSPLTGDNIKFQDYFEAGGVSGAAPAELGADASYGTMRAIVEDSPQPDIIPLLDNLERACPFVRSRS